jgi:AmmeMemoRadiSam system protein A
MFQLDEESKRELLQRARFAIARAIGADLLPDHKSLIPRSDVLAGAFVTLRMNGELRGCIGYPEPELPLREVIDRCAVSAAISDPRFPAVGVDEWRHIDIEISVLGPIERVADISEVLVGQHGLVVELGRRRGLLLPQVATERNWSATEFAAETCMKAGLRRDAWQNGAALFKFEADVFGEEI